jgi:hypothetical protein
MPVWLEVRNPDASMVMRYRVGLSELITKNPSALVTAARERRVSTSTTVIFAAGTIAPVGSATLPLMVLDP